MDNFTIVILARFQSQTLWASVQSAIATQCPIVMLCDDGEATQQVLDDIRAIDTPNIAIHYIENYHSVGQLRQQALSYVNTDYFMWLDGDDMVTADLPLAYYEKLHGGCDLVYSDVKLKDIRNDREINKPIPEFLKQPKGYLYEIERHWCAAGSAIALRTNIAKHIGYDIYSNAEDYLFKLNSLIHHLHIGFAEYGHYIYCRYNNSNSFWQFRQQSALRAGLLRLNQQKLYDLLDNSYFDKIYISWAKACVAQRCGSYEIANDFLSKMIDNDLTDEHICYNLNYQFLYHYMLGANHLFMGNEISAQHHIEQALDIIPHHINALNNLGLCYYWQNKHDKARDIWHHIAEHSPYYHDATLNHNAIMRGEQACNITALPFRAIDDELRY